MSATVPLAEYLFTRLRQIGIDAIHGVPGDYNLTLLDHVEPSRLLWVGSTNELNAGYAADGYARVKGVGALITTYGVGELSAINAIACAYAERAALVHIVGTPPRPTQDARLLVHHTLADGEYRHFGRMAAHVTVAQTNLWDPRTCPDQIDQALQQCLIHARPVYIEVPVDMVSVPVRADRLSTPLCVAPRPPTSVDDEVLAQIMAKVQAAKQPIILVDGETRALGLCEAVQALVTRSRWPTFTTVFGKGLVDETAPHVFGLYRGSAAETAVRSFFDAADLVLCFGPHYSSTNSYFWTSIPEPDRTVAFTQAGVQFGSQLVRDVSVDRVVAALGPKLDPSQLGRDIAVPDLPRDRLLSFADVARDEMIGQDKIWRVLAGFLRPGDIVMGETGTPGYGVREMPLPRHARLFAPVTWLSIGYMLPACQGAALAQRELVAASRYHGLTAARTVLLIGDGSFQMTAQELATIVRHHLNVVVFLINNDGYTIERCIHGMNQKYNDVSSWRYLQAPSFFGAPEDTFTASVSTYGELEQALVDPKLAEGTGLRMVEVRMDRNDAPIGPLLDLINKQKEAPAAK